MPIPVEYLLSLSVFLFLTGLFGVLTKRNALVVFMSLELMFNAGNLVFVSFARSFNSVDSQVIVFFAMTVAAAEVAIGLAMIVEIFRSKKSINLDELNIMKG